MDEFKKEIIRILAKKYVVSEALLEIPPDTTLGDIALPCFTLAKELKKSPKQIAQEIAKEIPATSCIRKIKATGPYVNFFLDKEKMSKIIFDDILKLKQEYGNAIVGREKQIMIEFPSPNTNKPLHLGHVRNCFIGVALSNILEACNYQVIRANLLNDRGIHICKSMLAYMKWGNGQEPSKKSDHFIGDFYVLFTQKAKEMPQVEDEAQELLRRWENGDREVLALWKKMNQWAYKGFDETLQRLGAKTDVTYYESEIFKQAKEMVLALTEKQFFQKDEKGNIVINLEQYNLPNKIVLRSDGTSIYITQDIYLSKLKFDQYPALEKSLIVTMHEQQLHFQQLFAILTALKFPFASKYHHVMYGIVNLPEGRMKSREGTVVDADDLLDEMHALAKQAVQERHPELTEKEVNARARIISMAALKFHILKHDDKKDIIFNPKEAISFEGDSGPYIQYVYARISSIIEKAGGKMEKSINHALLSEPVEETLILALARFPTIVQEAARTYRTADIPHYLLSLAQTFNAFYHSCPVLSADEDQKKARLLLIHCVRQVIKNGLALIGIEVVEEM